MKKTTQLITEEPLKPATNTELLPEYLALCPLDGRYASIGRDLSPYFSEYALVKNRVKVEIYWLAFLIKNIKSSEILNSCTEEDIKKSNVNL